MEPNYDPDTTPALMPPEGVVPNLIDPFTRQPLLVGISTTCMVLITTCIGIRLYTQLAILKKTQVEDYLLVFAGLGFHAFSIVMITAGNAGQGKHQWNVSVTGVLRVALLANILEVLYGPVMFAAKVAILLTLKRIFEGTHKNFASWSFSMLIVLNGFFYTSMFFAFVFACVPRGKITNPSLPGVCISTNGSILATSACNIISDISILFLPLFVIWSLKIPLKKKIRVGAFFAMGLFGCVSSIIRLYYSVQLALTEDITWAISPVGLWALAEFSTVIIASCLPFFPRFFQQIKRESKIKITSPGSNINSHGPIPYRDSSPSPRSYEATTKTVILSQPWDQSSSHEIISKDNYIELQGRNV